MYQALGHMLSIFSSIFKTMLGLSVTASIFLVKKSGYGEIGILLKDTVISISP